MSKNVNVGNIENKWKKEMLVDFKWTKCTNGFFALEQNYDVMNNNVELQVKVVERKWKKKKESKE
jgi:hypothetical protein